MESSQEGEEHIDDVILVSSLLLRYNYSLDYFFFGSTVERNKSR